MRTLWKSGQKKTVTTMGKQYLVVKVAQGLGTVVDMTPFAGLFTREAAQKFLEEVEVEEPGSTFMIQEVGVA